MEEQEIINKILKSSREIESVCNDHFLKEFARLHNIKPKHNKFSAKQEVITKRGYFPGVKKKYALWIINREGKNVDKYELKGLITQRSDYPEFTKEGILKILDMIIKDDKISFKKIKLFIEQTEEIARDICSNGMKTIAKPVSFVKDIAEYKEVPSQVFAMQLWNSVEYNCFEPGTKGYLFNINGINEINCPEKISRKWQEYIRKTNRTPDRIVLPYEEDKLPEYYNIDVDAMVKYAWIDRVQELLEPIWGRIYRNTGIMKISTF